MTVRSLGTLYAALVLLALAWWVLSDGLWPVLLFGAVVVTATLHLLVRTRGLGGRRGPDGRDEEVGRDGAR